MWTAAPSDVIGYLQSIYSCRNSLSAVHQHLVAIAYNYRLRSLPSPSADPLVAMFMRDLKRRGISTQVRQAKPMTKDLLKKLNDYILSGPRTLRQWRSVWRINLAFMCLLRWDDVRRLRVSL
jgi:hypothetical protein